MATLTIPDKGITLHDTTAIRAYLRERGVWFDQWEANCVFNKDATQDEILNAYAHALKPFMEQGGYRTADVISVHPETPGLDEIRARFLREHTHTEDEVRFFVDGMGMFWFNPEDGGPVFCVTCVAGDLLSVPAGMKHWFEMGEKPFVKTIRIFTDAAGWEPHYTNSGVDARYRGQAGA
ncbi:MAG TPA: cupin [Oculatellaceae cyanobacterium]|jgi:1,2-dihydroxy-3-keto-5-methylthiopentene dioxygenase